MTKKEEISFEDGKRKLPNGWRCVKLGEVCEINPTRPANLKREDETPTTFVPMSAVDGQLGTIVSPEIKSFAEVRKGYTYFAQGDVLFAKITPCMENGKHAIAENLIDDIGFGTTEFHVIRPRLEITSAWVHKFLRQPEVWKDATNYFTGSVGQQRVPKEFLQNLKILLPPLDEQKRIAGILNEKIEWVEKARKEAISQLEAAKDLPAAYLRAVFNSPEAQQWGKQRLGDMCGFIGGMQPPKHTFKYEPLPGYVRLVQIQDFRKSDVAVYIPTEEAKRSFDKSDVMIGRYGPPLFQILRGLSGAYNVALIKTVPKANLLKDYLYYLLQEPTIQNVVIAQSQRSAGQTGLQKEFVENLIVPIPLMDEQKCIAATLTQQMTEVEQLRKTLEKQLEAINQLPAPLLHQAFKGEL